MAKAHVLLVDTDATESARVVRYLRRSGVEVAQVADHKAMLSMMYDQHPDMIVLEKSSVENAQEDLENIRTLTDVPVIILISDRIQDCAGMTELHASGWMVRPISEQAILSEVMRQLGRMEEPTGALVIDWEGRLVHRSGRVITLSGKEFELLRLLASHAGQILSSERLARTLWGPADRRSRQDNLKHYVWRLRKKIEADPYHPKYLQTARGVGYRFKIE